MKKLFALLAVAILASNFFVYKGFAAAAQRCTTEATSTQAPGMTLYGNDNGPGNGNMARAKVNADGSLSVSGSVTSTGAVTVTSGNIAITSLPTANQTYLPNSANLTVGPMNYTTASTNKKVDYVTVHSSTAITETVGVFFDSAVAPGCSNASHANMTDYSCSPDAPLYLNGTHQLNIQCSNSGNTGTVTATVAVE